MKLPISYHSKLSKWPYKYTFHPNLDTPNIVFIVKHIMENNYTLLSAKWKKK